MGEAHSAHGPVRFGEFEVDVRAGELRKGDIKLKLQRQPFQILEIFLERVGEVVSREELRQRIWPADTFVDFDQGLSNAIKRLREALSDSAEKPRFIETIPRRGYRFIGNVCSRPAGRIESIAVLPLENLSGDPEQEYFADGMTEALITNLAKISALQVISRTSAMHYKGVHRPLREIARELHVDGVVEGTVMRSGQRIRISVQLINAHADTHIWAETYDRDLRGVLELQSEVARTIASEIKIQLTPEEQEQLDRIHQVVPGAYEAYLKGRYYWNWRTVTGIKKAAEFFEEAIRLDSHYAGGYSGLADAYVILGYWGFAPPDECAGKAKLVALKALEIDETLAEPHASLAFATVHYDQDFEAAEQEYRRSIQLNPRYATAHQWYGLHLAMMGRGAAAVAELKQALQIDPVSPIIHVALAAVHVWARQWDLAIEESQRALDLDADFLQGLWMLGWAHILKGMNKLGISELERGSELSGGAALFRFALAYAYAVVGKKQEAHRIRRQLEELSAHRYVMPYWIATIYAALDEKDEALHWLESAYRERAPWIVFLKVQPWLDNLVPDPRFQSLLRRMNFPQ